jgi:hypothetical protein
MTTRAGGSVIDPAAYIQARDYTKVAQAAPVLLPTWLPSWASSATPVVITLEGQPSSFFEVAWDIPYPSDPITETAGTSVRIDVGRETEDTGTPLSGATIQGDRRMYYTSYDGTCPPPDANPDAVLLGWNSGGFDYSVFMSPWPSCVAGFSINDAVAFADSLVSCSVTASTLECGATAAVS